ncbi:hypothetical protein PWT90_03519 [Aphanocladium album]|nr:hypothetical protein PWT90_03519 [Aphanocladium album]
MSDNLLPCLPTPPACELPAASEAPPTYDPPPRYMEHDSNGAATQSPERGTEFWASVKEMLDRWEAAAEQGDDAIHVQRTVVRLAETTDATDDTSPDAKLVEFLCESRQTVAKLFLEAGNYNNAEQLLVLVVESRTKRLGKNHRSTLLARGDRAFALYGQGQFKKALDLYLRLIDAVQQGFGPHDIRTVTLMNNQALVYLALSDYTNAEKLLKQVVTKSQDHQLTLKAMMRLAVVYRELDKREAAERQEAAVLEWSKNMDSVDPCLLTWKSDMAVFKLRAGELQHAKQIGEEVLSSQRETLGCHHPDTILSMNNLAMIYKASREMCKAKELLSHAIELNEQERGWEHYLTLGLKFNLAEYYMEEGNPKKAREIAEKLQDPLGRVFGEEHRHTKLCRRMVKMLSQPGFQQHFDDAVANGALPIYNGTVRTSQSKVANRAEHTTYSFVRCPEPVRINGRRDFVFRPGRAAVLLYLGVWRRVGGEKGLALDRGEHVSAARPVCVILART